MKKKGGEHTPLQYRPSRYSKKSKNPLWCSRYVTYITSGRTSIFTETDMNQQKSSIQLGFGQVSRLIGIADFEGPIHQLLKRFAAGQNIAIHLFPFCRHQVRIQGETSAYSFHKWRRWYRSIGLFFHHNSESPVLLCWVYGREEGRRELKNMIRAHCHPGAYPS